MAFDQHRRLQGFQQAVGNCAGGFWLVNIIQQYGEFIAPQARDADLGLGVDILGEQVRSTHAAGEASRDFSQQHIAGTVAQGVIDTLEIVQVEKQQGDHLALAFGYPQQQL